MLSRGNDRKNIFIDDKDRSSFLDAVETAIYFRDAAKPLSSKMRPIRISKRSTVTGEIRSA